MTGELPFGLDDDALFLMANLSARQTRLPFVVFVAQQGGFEPPCRIWISRTLLPLDIVAVVSVAPPVEVIGGTISPRELHLIRQWVAVNRVTIEAYWDGNIPETAEMLKKLVPLPTQAPVDRESGVNDLA